MVDLVSMDPWIFRHGVDAVKENIFDPVLIRFEDLLIKGPPIIKFSGTPELL